MDKVELSGKDIEALLAWRDDHQDEVRSHPAPLKAVEIVCKESGYVIKGIRKEYGLRLYLSKDGRSLGHTEFVHRFDGMWASRKNRMKATQDEIQSVLTVYCSLMALMAYGRMDQEQKALPWPEVEQKDRPPKKATKRSTRKPVKHTTYILHRANGVLLAAPKGTHASPRGIFTVRGHYRHYRSGKVVWIAEYRKGTGKKKSKTYKIGGGIDGQDGQPKSG